MKGPAAELVLSLSMARWRMAGEMWMSFSSMGGLASEGKLGKLHLASIPIIYQPHCQRYDTTRP